MKSLKGDGAKGLYCSALLIDQSEMGGTDEWGEAASLRLDNKNRMTGDCHVRICEGLGLKFPRATRLVRKDLIIHRLSNQIVVETFFWLEWGD